MTLMIAFDGLGLGEPILMTFVNHIKLTITNF